MPSLTYLRVLSTLNLLPETGACPTALTSSPAPGGYQNTTPPSTPLVVSNMMGCDPHAHPASDASSPRPLTRLTAADMMGCDAHPLIPQM